MKQPYALRFRDQKEIIRLLLSSSDADRAEFEARLVATPPDKAQQLLKQTLVRGGSEKLPWLVHFFAIWLVQLAILGLHLPFIAYLLFYLTAAVHICVNGYHIIFEAAIRKKIRRQVWVYLALSGDTNAIPLLMKSLYRPPKNAEQRQWNEKAETALIGLLDNLDLNHYIDFSTEWCRQFIERECFPKSEQSRVPMTQTRVYLMVAMLPVLKHQGNYLDDMLLRRLADASTTEVVSSGINPVVHDVAFSLLHPDPEPIPILVGQVIQTLENIIVLRQ